MLLPIPPIAIVFPSGPLGDLPNSTLTGIFSTDFNLEHSHHYIMMKLSETDTYIIIQSNNSLHGVVIITYTSYIIIIIIIIIMKQQCTVVQSQHSGLKCCYS